MPNYLRFIFPYIIYYILDCCAPRKEIKYFPGLRCIYESSIYSKREKVNTQRRCLRCVALFCDISFYSLPFSSSVCIMKINSRVVLVKLYVYLEWKTSRYTYMFRLRLYIRKHTRGRTLPLKTQVHVSRTLLRSRNSCLPYLYIP